MKPDTEQCKDCIDFCEVTLAGIAVALEKGEDWSEFYCALRVDVSPEGVRPGDKACEDFLPYCREEE